MAKTSRGYSTRGARAARSARHTHHDGPPDDTLVRGTFPSPVGAIEVVCHGERLAYAGFDDPAGHAERDRYLSRAMPGARLRDGALPDPITRAFRAYLAGSVDALDSLEVELVGSPFDRSVWRALRKIPAGTTTTYGAIARRVGKPQASRAVGGAVHRNPISVAIPCHRVIGKDGSLTGYGGGLARKRWLLEHERGATMPSRGALGVRTGQIGLFDRPRPA